VDQTQRPWRWQAAGGVDLQLAPATLTEFERAAAIRDSFFPAGGQRPEIRLAVTPAEIGPRVAKVELDVGGQVATMTPDNRRPAILSWPSITGSSQARLSIQAAGDAQEAAVTADGPWSLFRLFRQGRIDPSPGPERLLLAFTVGGQRIRLELTTGSISNPFTLPALGEFRCPSAL
jgi:type VI secretion system protein ImpL